MNVPTFSQDPLEFRGNLDEKVNEINTLYENLTSHLKKKSVLNQSKSFKEVNYDFRLGFNDFRNQSLKLKMLNQQ